MLKSATRRGTIQKSFPENSNIYQIGRKQMTPLAMYPADSPMLIHITAQYRGGALSVGRTSGSVTRRWRWRRAWRDAAWERRERRAAQAGARRGLPLGAAPRRPSTRPPLRHSPLAAQRSALADFRPPPLTDHIKFDTQRKNLPHTMLLVYYLATCWKDPMKLF